MKLPAIKKIVNRLCYDSQKATVLARHHLRRYVFHFGLHCLENIMTNDDHATPVCHKLTNKNAIEREKKDV